MISLLGTGRSVRNPRPNSAHIGATGGFNWSDIASGTDGSVIEPHDLSSLYQDAAGNTPVTAAGQLVRLAVSKRECNGLTVAQYMAANGISDPNNVPGNHISAPSDADRTTLSLSNGVYSLVTDGNTDGMNFKGSLAALTDADVWWGGSTSDDKAALISGAVVGSTSTPNVFMDSANSSNAWYSTPTPTGHVNGGPAIGMTRQALHTAFSTGSPLVFNSRNHDLSGYTAPSISGYTSSGIWRFAGSISGLAILPAGDAATRARILAELAFRSGASI